MKFIPVIIVIALLTVSLFGFAAMSHGSMVCDSLLSGVTGTDCPQTLISMALHHISAYSSFSEVTVSYATATFLSSLLLAIAAAYAFKQSFVFDRLRIFSATYLRVRGNPLLVARRKKHRWLSLLENSPSAL